MMEDREEYYYAKDENKQSSSKALQKDRYRFIKEK